MRINFISEEMAKWEKWIFHESDIGQLIEFTILLANPVSGKKAMLTRTQMRTEC